MFPPSLFHIVVEASYSGPSLEDEISVEFMQTLLEWFKAQRKLHSKYAYKVGGGLNRLTVHHRYTSCIARNFMG